MGLLGGPVKEERGAVGQEADHKNDLAVYG